MYTDKLKYQIAITLIKGIGPVIARQLVSFFGDEEVIFNEKKSQISKLQGMRPGIVVQLSSKDILERAEREVLFCEKNNIRPLHFKSNIFPQRLLNCDDAPTLLFEKGTADLNSPKVLSIVGTRNATEEGKANCYSLIEQLSGRYPNLIIVSGLAYGIDFCAHQSCLSKNLETVAIVGHGLDRIYPYVHRNLAKEMIQKGAILTEFISETEPARQNFVKRNRIIAGISDATIVVESGVKGGALITAHMASAYNRDVLVFPGRSNDEYSKGCNWLIKNNVAALIENADDLDKCLGWESFHRTGDSVQTKLFHEFKSETENTVYQILIKEREVDINQLCLNSELPISKLSPILLNFEFDGLIKCLPGNKYRII